VSELHSRSSPAAAGVMSAGSLKGLRVLVVEDEMLVSMVLEGMLDDFGCVVAASAPTVDDALSAIDAQYPLDAAILDVNLGGEKVFPVADDLGSRGVPFLFCTGYGPADLADRYPGRPLLFKPYQAADLAAAIQAARLANDPPPPSGMTH